MKDAAGDRSPPYSVGEIVAWFAEHYPKVNPSSVRAHVTGLTANDRNRHHYAGESWSGTGFVECFFDEVGVLRIPD